MDEFSAVQYSTVSPAFLSSNATSHQHAFGAVAELLDNAVDPDARATQFSIDYVYRGGKDALIFLDNGYGMDPYKLRLLLGFGHSEKLEKFQGRAIGQYGNGFKSGTMRLGRSALVLTCHRNTGLLTAGLMSQVFLKDIRADRVMIPIVVWRREGGAGFRRIGLREASSRLPGDPIDPILPDAASDQSLAAICKYSCITDEATLLAQAKAVFCQEDAPASSGTLIMVSDLMRLPDTNNLELDFDTDERDVRIRAEALKCDDPIKPGGTPIMRRPDRDGLVDVPLDYSLRAYVQWLYLTPHLIITLRGEKVRTKRVTSSLKHSKVQTYQPRATGTQPSSSALGRAEITIGFNVTDLTTYGVMLYHRGRLIESYKRLGVQSQANDKGVGVLCVVDQPFLRPTHNKQSFNFDPQYQRLLKKIEEYIKTYWYAHVEKDGPPEDIEAALNAARGIEEVITRARFSKAPRAKPAARTAAAPADAAPVVAPADASQPDSTAAMDAAAVMPAEATLALVSALPPDRRWVQCNSCNAWRILPDSVTAEEYDEIEGSDEWTCKDHPDPQTREHGCTGVSDVDLVMDQLAEAKKLYEQDMKRKREQDNQAKELEKKQRWEQEIRRELSTATSNSQAAAASAAPAASAHATNNGGLAAPGGAAAAPQADRAQQLAHDAAASPQSAPSARPHLGTVLERAASASAALQNQVRHDISRQQHLANLALAQAVHAQSQSPFLAVASHLYQQGPGFAQGPGLAQGPGFAAAHHAAGPGTQVHRPSSATQPLLHSEGSSQHHVLAPRTPSFAMHHSHQLDAAQPDAAVQRLQKIEPGAEPAAAVALHGTHHGHTGAQYPGHHSPTEQPSTMLSSAYASGPHAQSSGHAAQHPLMHLKQEPDAEPLAASAAPAPPSQPAAVAAATEAADAAPAGHAAAAGPAGPSGASTEDEDGTDAGMQVARSAAVVRVRALAMLSAAACGRPQLYDVFQRMEDSQLWNLTALDICNSIMGASTLMGKTVEDLLEDVADAM